MNCTFLPPLSIIESFYLLSTPRTSLTIFCLKWYVYLDGMHLLQLHRPHLIQPCSNMYGKIHKIVWQIGKLLPNPLARHCSAAAGHSQWDHMTDPAQIAASICGHEMRLGRWQSLLCTTMGEGGLQFDCIVIGGGNAGFSAAHSAREHGCQNVLIIDSCSPEYIGGNSYFTAGGFRTVHDGLQDVVPLVSNVAPDKLSQIDITSYTSADFTGDIMRMSASQSDPGLVESLVSNSRKTVQWLRDHVGVRFVLSFNRQAFLVDGVQKFWGGMVLATEDGGKGLMVDHMRKAAEEGVEFWDSCKATELIVAKGAVVGVVVNHAGVLKRLLAKGVVIACGGFESSKSLRKSHLGENWGRAKVRGTPFNIGDGFNLVSVVHAQEVGEKGGCHSTCWDAHAPDNAGDRKITNQFTKSGYPLGIMVNVDGKRFVDEGEDYRNYTYAKFGRLINEQPEGVVWQIWDSKVTSLLRVEEYAEDVVRRITSNSVDELVAKLAEDGVQNAEQLKATILDFNQGVSGHRAKQGGLKFDPAVKDGLGTEGVAPPKSNWAQTLDTPPYVAVKVACGITFTFYGLKIDPMTAAVINKEQQPIPGLFCAGEMVGGLFYNNYPGGSGLTSGAVFGRIAGRSVAREVSGPIIT